MKNSYQTYQNLENSRPRLAYETGYDAKISFEKSHDERKKKFKEKWCKSGIGFFKRGKNSNLAQKKSSLDQKYGEKIVDKNNFRRTSKGKLRYNRTRKNKLTMKLVRSPG